MRFSSIVRLGETTVDGTPLVVGRFIQFSPMAVSTSHVCRLIYQTTGVFFFFSSSFIEAKEEDIQREDWTTTTTTIP